MNINQLYVVGDSISKGCVQNLEPGKKYSVYPENMWNIVSKDNNFELINKSVFGSTITKGHRQLTRDLNSGIKPDICVIEFGGNDCDYRWPELFEKGEENFFPNTKVDEFEKNLSEMVDEVREKGIFPVLMTLPPLVADHYFNVISEGLDREKLLDWMHDPWFLYREQELYSNTVAEYARKNDIFLIDIRKQFLLQRNSPVLMCNDGIHPNIEGHKFMASYINSVIKIM